MDNLQWFKFSPAKWSMGKTKKLSMEQRAEYLDLCCSYWIAECSMGVEDMREHSDEVDLFVKRGLIGEDGIAWLNQQHEEASKKSDRAKESARKRWSKRTQCDSNANAMRTHSDSNANAMQIREEKIKTREDEDKIRQEQNRQELNAREREVADAPVPQKVIEFDSEGNSLNEEQPIESKPKTTRFKKPTLLEVQDYFEQKYYPNEAEVFYNYYESNGWKVGRNPMKNWHAAVSNWIKRAKENQLKPKYNGAKKSPHDITPDEFSESIRKGVAEWNRRHG